MINSNPNTPADEAMLRVGWLLTKWGQLETKIGHGIYTLTKPADRKAMKEDKIPRTLTGKLGAWENAHQQTMGGNKGHMDAIKALRKKIEDEAPMRNTLAHSIANMVTGPSLAIVQCYPDYLKWMMQKDTYESIQYDLDRLENALNAVEPLIVGAMMLNQEARKVFAKKNN
jgi:hypothetical protein